MFVRICIFLKIGNWLIDWLLFLGIREAEKTKNNLQHAVKLGCPVQVS